MKKVGLALLCSFVILGLNASTALALPAFKKLFEEQYVKKSDNSDFQAAAKKASCNVCHVKGKKKDVRNAYGEVLAKSIEGDAKDRIAAAKEKGKAAEDAEKEKVNKELVEALKKVEKEKSPSGGTYGERLSGGKLPVE